MPVDVRAVLTSESADMADSDGPTSSNSTILDEQRVLTPAGSISLLITTLVRMCVMGPRIVRSLQQFQRSCSIPFHRLTTPETRASIGAIEFTKDSPAGY